MNILENLENLNISEECFNDIIDIVEDLLMRGEKEVQSAWKDRLKDKHVPVMKAERRHLDKEIKQASHDYRNANKEYNTAVQDANKAKQEHDKTHIESRELHSKAWNAPIGSPESKDLNKKWLEKEKENTANFTKYENAEQRKKDIVNKQKEIGNEVRNKAERRNALNQKIANFKGSYVHSEKQPKLK